MKRLLLGAVCLISLSSCGSKKTAISDKTSVSANVSETETTESSTSKPAATVSITESAAVYVTTKDTDKTAPIDRENNIPENAAYKQTKKRFYHDIYTTKSVSYYDKNDNILLTLNYSATDSGEDDFISKTVYYYNTEKKLISEAFYIGEDSEQCILSQYEYEDDNIIREKQSHYGDVSDYTLEYIYNVRGNLVQKQYYTSDGIQSNSIKYEYSDDGKILTEKDDISVTSYTYDENGNIAEKSVYRDLIHYKTVYTYDGKNRIKSETTYYDANAYDDESLIICEYEYEDYNCP